MSQEKVSGTMGQNHPANKPEARPTEVQGAGKPGAGSADNTHPENDSETMPMGGDGKNMGACC
jgi:hypothetical protein